MVNEVSSSFSTTTGSREPLVDPLHDPLYPLNASGDELVDDSDHPFAAFIHPGILHLSPLVRYRNMLG